MRYLIDTNILLRATERRYHEFGVVRQALRILWELGAEPCYTAQILSEFWNVSTRPASARGGLGISVTETNRRARLIESRLIFLPDTWSVYVEWRRLLVAHRVTGVQVHDARLVATMKIHDVAHLLTFNGKDFTRYQDITVVSPNEIIQSP